MTNYMDTYKMEFANLPLYSKYVFRWQYIWEFTKGISTST